MKFKLIRSLSDARLLNEFGTADDASHPALRQAMKAKAEAERREDEADNGGMEQQPKDYAEDEEAGPDVPRELHRGEVKRTIVIGKGPEGSEAEKIAYSVAEQLRSPEDGIHAQAGIGEKGWFVTVVINQKADMPW